MGSSTNKLKPTRQYVKQKKMVIKSKTKTKRGKNFLGELLKPIGGKFLLHCNFEVSKLNISLPAFYRHCLVAWSELNARESSSVHEIAGKSSHLEQQVSLY